MKRHLHRQYFSYRPEQLYDLVVDIESYPQFLPWCLEAHVLSQTETEMIADLSVGYRFVQETFRSRVCLTPHKRIDVVYLRGPFESLKNHWVFQERGEGETQVDFMIEFSLQSSLFQKVVSGVFEKAFETMLGAFERRAHALYG